MARKTRKRLVVHFYDDVQGDQCITWLDRQDNMGDSIRQLIVQASQGNPVNQSSGNELGELRRYIEQLEGRVRRLEKELFQGPSPVPEPPKINAPTFNTRPPQIETGNGQSADNLLNSLNNF